MDGKRLLRGARGYGIQKPAAYYFVLIPVGPHEVKESSSHSIKLPVAARERRL